MPRPVGLRVEGVFEVELELASDEQVCVSSELGWDNPNILQVRRYYQHFQQVQKDGGKGKLTKNETKDVAAALVPPMGDTVQTSTLLPVETSTPPPVQTSTLPPVPPTGDTLQTITLPPGDTSTPPPVETSTPPPIQTSTPPPVPPAGNTVQTSTPPPVQTSTPLPVP
jgi:hypothetical protein